MVIKNEKIQLNEVELEGLKDAIRDSSMPDDSKQTLLKTLGTFNDICMSLQQKKASIANLRSLLGIKTEKDLSFCRSYPLDSGQSSNSTQKKRLYEVELQEIQKMLAWNWIQVQK